MLRERSGGHAAGNPQIAESFLVQHWEESRQLGWTDLDLFGCHPDPAFALVRYDCMGAVTISAVMDWPIAAVSVDGIRCANGLRSRRKPGFAAVPVWEVFPSPP
jgi:hypothetical protein